MKIYLRLLFLLAAGFICLVGLFGCVQRKLLYFPSHADVTAMASQAGLAPWMIEGEYTGYARVIERPRKIWFVLHGNGGQAGQRGYIVARVAPMDSVYVLEYPGYGLRPGNPSRTTFDAAALEAYSWLVAKYGAERIVVLGESLGSGPASQLARASVPPPHIVLITPFDVLTDVAQEKFGFLPVRLIMFDRWNNVEALQNFKGRVDIFGGTYDNVIPVHHARKLAAAIPGANYHEFAGGHNAWANAREVDLAGL